MGSRRQQSLGASGQSDYHFTIFATPMAEGGWLEEGTASGGGGGESQYSYAGGGSLFYPTSLEDGTTKTFSSTNTESGEQNYSYEYTGEAELSGGSWAATEGEWSGNGDGWAEDSFSSYASQALSYSLPSGERTLQFR